MAFPHISKTFVSGGIMCSGLRTPRREITEEMLGNLNINAISEEKSEEGSTSGIYLVEPESAVKGSAIADFLASRALEDYEPLNFDFPNEDLMYVATIEKDFQEGGPWKLNFDGASNAIGNGIGAVLVSPNGDHYPFTSKLDFDSIERKIKVLEIYGDSALVIYQLKGEWETRDPKLVRYRKLVMELMEEFYSVTFSYLLRDENQMADALATLASMFKVNKLEDMKPIQISIYEAPAHCCNIDNEGKKDDHPWYHDILRYVKSREYPDHATENDKKILRRLAIDYVLDGDILYKRGKDQKTLCRETRAAISGASVVILYSESWQNSLS
ncbi:uncharacterized protein [Gossypium hirsutum]|uniref:RNase H type-1 domain-containing protein n=1 Tax=Gossypium hirsutum TaxID=3635 RepID=A0A1U8KCD7_GOSHI|nr:uncharacterized protein LOC107915523 [Gossypium hirsutum]